VLDSIPPEQVMQCQSEEDCARVAKCLPSTEAALLGWAVNLMADVVQEEQINKMNARNIAMVFAPNMTQVIHCPYARCLNWLADGNRSTLMMQMADPLTALMYAVQVMNFLKMLIQKTLKYREESNLEDATLPQNDPFDENGHKKPSMALDSHPGEGSRRPSFVNEEPLLNSPAHSTEDKPAETIATEGDAAAPVGQSQKSEVLTSMENAPNFSQPALVAPATTADASSVTTLNSLQAKGSRSPNSRRTRKGKGQSGTRATPAAEKSRGTSIVSRINYKVERFEAWR
jgi:hypothetical protein